MVHQNDSYGEVELDQRNPWGKATQRSLQFFSIGQQKMPEDLIKSLIIIKRSAASVNEKHSKLDPIKAKSIISACDQLLADFELNYFPLSIWQTGSGTQTNMNVNEVIAHFASRLNQVEVHANDDVNQSQSSNDVFPSALSMMSVSLLEKTLESLERMIRVFDDKSLQYMEIAKVGRTHLQDAVLMSVGQEFLGFSGMLKQSCQVLKASFELLYNLPLGATAVGTGVNAYADFSQEVTQKISEFTGRPFKSSQNMFSDLSGKNAIVFLAGNINVLASSYYKVVNDIRWLSSGPKAGLAEIILPANEAGSSIMPGKVNPTQCESAMMIALHCMSLAQGVTLANSQGNFQLNTMMPLMAYQISEALILLEQSMKHFVDFALTGLQINLITCEKNVTNSVMVATRLNPVIGYDQATWVVKTALERDCSIREILEEELQLDKDLIHQILDVESMIFPNKKDKRI